MLFAIISEDVKNSLAARMAARPAHLERLKALDAQQRLILAGPHPHTQDEGFTGSLVVADFADHTAAQAWADQDPYVAGGVYAEVKVKPFKQVFPIQE